MKPMRLISLAALLALLASFMAAPAMAQTRAITGLDAIPPISTNTGWAQAYGRGRAIIYPNIVVRGTTGLTDAPVLTLRPYLRTPGSTLVAGLASWTSTRQFIANDSTRVKCQKTVNNGVGYTDYSAAVNDNSGATQADLDALDTVANGDWVVFGAPNPFIGVAVDMDAANVNATASTTTVWSYWNGSAWTALSNVTDGPLTTTTAFQKDGQVTWDLPTDWAASTINSISMFWVRASVPLAVSANVDIEELDVILPITTGQVLDSWGEDVFFGLESVGSPGTGTLAYSGSISVTFK